MIRLPGDRRPAQQATAGDLDGARSVLERAERVALEGGVPGEAHEGDRHALAHPVPDDGEEPGRPPLGVLSVVRLGRPFSRNETDLFHYLGEQTARSIENVALHERVRVQAVTDELTGLSNHRRFQEALVIEVERARRFGQPLGLVMLDIDNFKRVNDTYGHQQGDAVLRVVADVLRATSREIDEPSRYGGEELAVALPQTDLEGAYNLAERVRVAIEGLDIPAADGGPSLRVTASFGAAALPESAEGKESLVAAADAALYRAKRSGKNRTERAERPAADASRAG